MSWFEQLRSEQLRKKATRRFLVPVVAIGATVSLATYEFAKPASAAAPPRSCRRVRRAEIRAQ